ncbi:MAG: hypothetical protein HQM08_13320 [Candidatus Riflebacteria bacterium]|nr:hypothetical protein [Candidatus Riflebacteria bacterium]
MKVFRNFIFHKKLFSIIRGFSLIEIVMVLGLAAAIVYPFTKMFTYGLQGSYETYEHIVAYNLARDKIEEVKSLPFDIVKSDFENFRDIYSEMGNDYMEAYGTKDGFEKIFSDIYTPERIKDENEKVMYEKFMQLYKGSYKREYSLYPDEVSPYRRILDVDDKIETKVPPRLKKITVRVFGKRGTRIAEVVTLISLHK